MPSYNVAMIQDLANKSYGMNLDTQQADAILGQTQGDYNKLTDYFTFKQQSSPEYQTNQAITQAQKLLDFQKQANQPIVETLTTAKDKLSDTYSKLVESIKGSQQVDVNRQTLATNNEMGRRGILNTSGAYEQNMANSLLPVNTSYARELVGAEQNYNQDDIQLALQLASAKAGNPLEAISSGMNLTQYATNLANSRYMSPEERELMQAQTRNYNAQASAQGQSSTSLSDQFATLSGGQTLYDLINNKVVYNNPYKGTSGGGDPYNPANIDS